MRKLNTEWLEKSPTNADLTAMREIRKLLDEFYPEVRIAILEYCLIVANKDNEA
jgi:hypothetical protein